MTANFRSKSIDRLERCVGASLLVCTVFVLSAPLQAQEAPAPQAVPRQQAAPPQQVAPAQVAPPQQPAPTQAAPAAVPAATPAAPPPAAAAAAAPRPSDPVVPAGYVIGTDEVQSIVYWKDNDM
jgi:hypothetical protein